MKRIFSACLGVLIIGILVAAPVLAAGYSYDITLTESSGNPYTQTPFIASVNNTGLISQGYLSSTGLDGVVKDGGTSLPTLVTNDKVLFVDNLNANQSKTVQYTTGNDPVSSMPIIVGTGGKITTPYNASLELGTNFRIEVNAPVRTDIGGIIMTTGGFGLGASSAGAVEAEIDEAGGEVDLALSGVSPTSSHDIVVSGNGAEYTLTVDGTSTTATETTGVPYSGDNFVWDGSGVMPYINYIKMGQGASLTQYTYVEEQQSGHDFIYKLDSTNLSSNGLPYYTFEDGYQAYPHSMCIGSDGYIYVIAINGVVGSSTTASVLKIDPTTMTLYDNQFTLFEHGVIPQRYPSNGQVMCIEGSYLYLAVQDTTITESNPYFIYKIATADMSINLSSTAGGYTAAGVQSIDCSGGYLFFISDGEGSMVAKVDESDLSFVTSNYDHSTYFQADLKCSGDYVYVRDDISYNIIGTYSINAYLMSDMSFADAISANNTDDKTALLSDDNNNLYWISDNGSSTLNITSFVGTDSAPFTSGNNWVSSNAFNGYAATSNNNYVYVSDDGVDQLKVDDMTLAISRRITGISYNIIATPVSSESLLYQPNTMILGTVLPDLDGTQDGIITWGANPSGVTITVGGLTPTAPTVYGAGNYGAFNNGGAGTINLQNPLAPNQLYTELDASKVPFGSTINELLNEGGVPQALWWFPFIFVGAVIIGMLVYDATQRTGGQGSLLTMCITIEILLVIFGVMGVTGVSGMIPLWSALLFPIPAVALILSRRHVGWG